jgi:hypothetical protein
LTCQHALVTVPPMNQKSPDPWDDQDQLPLTLTRAEWAQTWAVLAVAVVLFAMALAYAPFPVAP